jgi:hypothetical protein
MTKKQHAREIAKLEELHRDAVARGDREGAKMLAAEMVRHALQQHHGL